MAFWIGLSKNGLIAVLVVSSTDCLTENHKWHWSEVQYIPQSVQFTVSSVRAFKRC